MSDKEFLLLLQHMREAQKKYFSSRNAFYLQNAIRLEQRVDAEIAARIAVIPAPPPPPTLF